MIESVRERECLLMKFGDGIEQAIHCVLMLNSLQPEGALPAAALAEYHGVSTSYLLKHLQALSGAGLLMALPGPSGGYRLAKPARSPPFAAPKSASADPTRFPDRPADRARSIR